MPVIPTVYNTIRPGDYQTNTVKAYKRYTVTNSTFSASGYRAHDAIWKLHPPDVGDPSVTYPENYDDTNKHVVWKSIDHRYYRNPYDPANCHEGTNRQKTEKNYFYSASILSCPYLDVGESIKPGSVTVTNGTITLQDDGNGNLRDTAISTASFATASRCFFYMSFNNEFRHCEGPTGFVASSSVEYELRGVTRYAEARNVTISTATASGTVISVGVSSSSLVVSNSPITTVGTISVELPANLSVTGQLLLSSSQNLVNGGAANLATVASYFTTSAASTATLAAGSTGQIKTFMMVADGGDMVITVTNAGWKSSGTGTITFNDIGDGCTLQYINSKWYCIGQNGVAFG